jgi:hypothetical protein
MSATNTQKPLVYLETSFVSYLTARVSANPKIALDQSATRRWWEEERMHYELRVSEIVLNEIGKGDAEQVRQRIALLDGIPSLPVTPAMKRLAGKLLAAHALPPNAEADAVHIAIAAVAGARFLLTWNCRHIANATMLPLTVETVSKAGYRCPSITTPAQLLET